MRATSVTLIAISDAVTTVAVSGQAIEMIGTETSIAANKKKNHAGMVARSRRMWLARSYTA
jgi:hypothetical protein